MKRSKIVTRKAKNFVARAITYISGIVFMVSICSVDSESWIPIASLIVSGLWLTFYAYLNGYLCATEKGGKH